MRFFIVCLVVALAQGCASVDMLPKSADQVDFSGDEGKTGWSQYRQYETFNGWSIDQVYDAAKVGLGDAGFSLRKANKSAGYVIGEHGMTLHDWNIIAGVYFLENEQGTNVAVLVEGSKDFGFSGDATGDGWTGKILQRMRGYLNDVYHPVVRAVLKE